MTQGIYEMNRRLYEQAVHSFTLAIEDKNEFGQAYVLRSRCQTLYDLQSLHPNVYMIVLISSLENNEKAQEDARMALEIDKKDIKAIMAKAESLFAGGHFELGNYML